jgi:hypothetical protein
MSNPSKFEKGFNIGNVVLCYHPGYWQIVSFERCFADTQCTYAKFGEEITSKANLKLLFKEDFSSTPSKGTQKSCSLDMCSLVKIEDLRQKLLQKLNETENIIQFLGILSKNKYANENIKLSNSQIAYAINKFSSWIDFRSRNGDGNPTSADISHSALLERMLSGKEPLEHAPPKRMSYPWYALSDGEKIKINTVFEKVVERDGLVFVAGAGPFNWESKEEGILVFPSSGEKFLLKGGYIQKIQS